MRFSIYSEMQQHQGKPAAQLYAEVLEQMVHADRLGYDVYALIEHYFFPRFSISSNPTAMFAAAAQRTQHIRFRTMLHCLPLHNPVVLASAIAATDLLTQGRYEWGVGRGHGWMPEQAGQALDEAARPRYEEAVELLFKALATPEFSHQGQYFDIPASRVVPYPERRFRIFLGGTSDHTYLLAARNGWGVAVPPLLPYKALAQQLDLYRRACDEAGTEADITWIHACHLDEDRATAMREARHWIRGFIEGNCSPLTDHPVPEVSRLNAAGYGFYASGLMQSLLEIPFETLVAEDFVWVGTPEEIAERVDQTLRACPGIKEIAITVNAGGAAHWMAIKNQQLFAEQVLPRVRARLDASD